MLRSLVSALALLALTGVGVADPFYGLFYYQAPEYPTGGDCAAIAAKIGPSATWYGELSGNRIDRFNYKTHGFAARGCFANEYDCRVWQNVAINYLRGGPVLYTRCTRGAPSSY